MSIKTTNCRKVCHTYYKNTMYPSLSALTIDKSYKEVVRKENDDGVQNSKRRLQNVRSRGITKSVRPNALQTAQKALDRALGKTHALENWLALDFETRSMPRFEHLFTNLSNIVRASTQKPASPCFDVASITNDADHQQQIKLLDDTYNAYVAASTDSEPVARWVQARGEDGNAAPHEILTLYMLRQARVTSPKDERIAVDIDEFAPLANRSRLRAWANALYTLLIEAPRTTEPILLVRSVRSSHRSPMAWFRTATGSPMKTGNAIVLPTFWATSTLDQASSWLQHGPPSAAWTSGWHSSLGWWWQWFSPPPSWTTLGSESARRNSDAWRATRCRPPTSTVHRMERRECLG